MLDFIHKRNAIYKYIRKKICETILHISEGQNTEVGNHLVTKLVGKQSCLAAGWWKYGMIYSLSKQASKAIYQDSPKFQHPHPVTQPPHFWEFILQKYL